MDGQKDGVGGPRHSIQPKQTQSLPNIPDANRDRRRSSLASIHEHIIDWFRGAAIRELIIDNLIDQFCPMLN
jgi:hypothetical protein